MHTPTPRYRRSTHLLATLGLLLLPLARGSAQASAERALVEDFRDSLNATSDSLTLLGLEQRLIAQAKGDRGNALLHLKLGFLALRLADLGGTSHYEDAASEFQWAIDLRPDWPYSWYGMGLAELGVGDSKVAVVAGLQTMFGKDALARSAAAYAKSAEVDPSFVHGLVELSNTALRQRVNIRLGVALDALRRSAVTEAGQNPEVLLARGRVERMAGDPDSAIVAFQSYRERPGARRSLGQLELARTRLMRGDLGGGEDYFAGAESDEPDVVAAYRSDFLPMASDSMLGEFDAQRGTYRAAWLRRFWSERDDAELRRKGERLAEHYRRLYYARRNFALATENRQYDIAERFRSGSKDFDDRGIIYIRHGEPTARAAYQSPDVEPNESWRYARADGDLLFHFVARQDVQDYRLVESLFDVLGYSYAVRLQASSASFANTPAEQLVISRERLSPVYQRLAAAASTSSSRLVQAERSQGGQSLAVGTITDSYEPAFQRELRARTQVLAVGERDGKPLLQVAVALSGEGLEPQPVARGLLYSVRVRFTALDDHGRVAASLDTTRNFVAQQPVPKGEFLVGLASVPADAWGKLTYRIAVQQGTEIGMVLPRQHVDVPQPTALTINISDLVLGARNARLSWRPTPTDTVYFNPVGVFRRTEPMELYYEIGGLERGQSVTTTLGVRKGEGGKGFLGLFGGSDQLSLKFEEQSPGGRWRIGRSIAIDKLKPGDYTLEVTIVAPDGTKDARRQQFRVAP